MPALPPLLKPPDELEAEQRIDEPLLRALLREQHPDLAGAPLERFAEGWDNVLLRIGDDWLARMPRRLQSAPLVPLELRWLPLLAPHLPLPIPVPVRRGRPGAGYPWQWSISRWLEGGPAASAELEPERAAETLAGFVKALHALEPPADAPKSAFRGVPPRLRGDSVHERLGPLAGIVDVARVTAAWQRTSGAPDWAGPPVWCHGDLHPFNMLAHEGDLSAVLDWGDMHAGEPAPDLASAWMLLPTSSHARFRGAYGEIDDATWERAHAWALFFGVMFVSAGEDGAGEGATALGLTTLDRALE